MKKIITTLFFGCLFLAAACFAQSSGKDESGSIIGFWQTLNMTTAKPESIIAIYPYQGRYFGRIVMTYNEQGQVFETLQNHHQRAPGVKGDPYYVGMDILYNLEKKGDKYLDGKIIDPQKGSVYGAEAWLNKNGDLILRGKILFFGENQTWKKASAENFPSPADVPDLKTLIPVIPQVKK